MDYIIKELEYIEEQAQMEHRVEEELEEGEKIYYLMEKRKKRV